jgi:ABC-type glycerol-3-phosphate transport system substrate-binding protein
MIVRAGTPNSVYLCDSKSVFRYWYDETASAAANEEINIFSLRPDETVQQAVVAFNRSQSDVLAVYKVAMGQDAAGTEQDYIKALNTELLAGTGPDVLVLDGLPIASYLQKGVLAELSEVMDSAEPVLPNIRTASQTADGKLYAIPCGMRIPLAYADGDASNAFSSLSNLADASEASGEVPLLAKVAYNYQMLAEVLLNYYGSDLYQNKDGAVTDFLTNIGRISKAIGANDKIGEDWKAAQGSTQEEMLKVVRMQNGGPQIWANATNRATAAMFLPMGSLYGGMVNLAAAEQLKKTFCGINGQYLPVGIVGINRASQHMDAAASFLKTLFSYDVQTGNKYAEQFPVNQKAVEAVFSHVDNTISSGMTIDPEITIYAEWPTQAMRDMLLSMVKEVSHPLSTDHTLSDLVVPQIVSYLDGSSTLEDASAKVESVISTYLSE